MAPAIEIEKLSKSYREVEVLHGIDCRVEAGESVVLCGRSGSGKSTLLRCINGLETADSGSIVVSGVTLTGETRILRHVRRRAAMVFQDFALFAHMSALDNVAFAPVRVLGEGRAAARARAMACLAGVRMDAHAAKRPAQLSGGQKQRVAIARALAMEPDVLLFDEPTSALDPESVGEVLDVMRRLAREGRTMVTVTHEMGFAREAADRVLFMASGRIVDDCRSSLFFANPSSPEARDFLGRVIAP